jgi:TIR domain/SIR2-like domain
MDEDFFWGDLLAHIRDQVLVPVVGPDLALVNVDGREQTFTSLIGQRLVEEYRLRAPAEVTTTGEAVALVLGERGRDEVDRLYRVIYDIINDLDPAPGDALRDLAAIDDLRLFVSTTPDRLLAKALNTVRFQGREETRELSYAPNQSTNAQAKNAQEADPTDTVVLNLFGKAVSSPQYAIHDEDLLEWLCALLTEAASFPDWLSAPLKQRPTLFIGYDIPDWIGRYLLRMSSGDTRLSQRNQQFFFVGSSTAYEPSLSRFLKTFCRSTLVQHLDTDPIKFVADLRERWEKQPRSNPPEPGPRPIVSPVTPGAPSIFISYMREDGDAARRLYDEITKLGGDVFFDDARLLPGDTWEPEILNRIERTVQLFVPVISANTERETEGYVFREWNAAAERALSIMGRRFIVPVLIDDAPGDPNRLHQIPPDFRRLNFGRAPGGEPDASLLEMLTNEIRAMRRAIPV